MVFLFASFKLHFVWSSIKRPQKSNLILVQAFGLYEARKYSQSFWYEKHSLTTLAKWESGDKKGNRKKKTSSIKGNRNNIESNIAATYSNTIKSIALGYKKLCS